MLKLRFLNFILIKKRFVINFQMDIWSFGVVIWETLTRVKPYEGLNRHQILHAVFNGLSIEKLKMFFLSDRNLRLYFFK